MKKENINYKKGLGHSFFITVLIMLTMLVVALIIWVLNDTSVAAVILLALTFMIEVNFLFLYINWNKAWNSTDEELKDHIQEGIEKEISSMETSSNLEQS